MKITDKSITVFCNTGWCNMACKYSTVHHLDRKVQQDYKRSIYLHGVGGILTKS